MTKVILGGEVTSGFNALANRLEQVGATVDRIGSHLRDFEDDSVQVYRNYEDNMLAAEYALSAQYSSATELSKVMQSLDKYASSWAATTIFHTNDVSAAINEAAHAGWDFEQIVLGIPQAMLIAQAGGLELSTGLDYLVKMMGSTNTEFEDMGTVIDQWSKAANLSATNIDEMGEAFLAMGAAAQFGDTTQELITLLAVLANVGTTGSKAGTALRGAMMRIIAPTTKAEYAMEILGAEADELEEILADTSVTKAAETLEGIGFSAYDAQGNLLPMIDIFTNLYNALEGLDEQAQNEILSAIFPTRNIATAKAFMAAVGNGKMAGLFESIGDSEGYAAKGADIMMSGLTGAIETLASKWEEFQRSVGETLAPWIETVAGALGSIVDWVNSLDEATLSGLVGGMTALAELGPVMLGAGGIIKAVSALGWQGVLLTATVVAAGALWGYFSKLNEISFTSNFGQMGLDLDTLGAHVDGVKTKFDGQVAAIARYETELNRISDAYVSTSSAFSELLLTDVLTEKELTPEDKEKLIGFGESMGRNVLDGLALAKGSDMTMLDAIFGNSTLSNADEVGNVAAQVVDNWYDDMNADAFKIGAELRKQMTAALADDQLDEEERQAIQASVDRYNEILAQIQSQMDAESYYGQLYKAQSVSWDSISGYLEDNAAKQAQDLAALDEEYAARYGHYAAAYRYAIDNGLEVTTLSGERRMVTEDDLLALGDALDIEREKARQEILDKYGGLSTMAFEALMNDNFKDAWTFLRALPLDRDENGAYNLTGAFDGKSKEELDALQAELMRLYGNRGPLKKAAGLLDTEHADYFNELLTVSGTAGGWARELSGKMDRERSAYETALLFMADDLTSQQTALDELKTKRDTLNAQINETIAGLNLPQAAAADIIANAANIPGIPGLVGLASLLSKKDQLDLDITEAEGQIATLQGEIDALEASEPLWIVAELDTTNVDNYNPPPKTMRIRQIYGDYAATYAEGGRATEPSIFGDAGAEWAIPEEHSERTAALLNKAREASGFSWGDLITRFGGLNGNPSNRAVTVNYSPTINAADARGVADALRADKTRLMKMIQELIAEQKFRDDVEVYA